MPSDHPRMRYEQFNALAASARTALLALGTCVDAAGIDKGLSELIKLRASQINGCAFCVQLHLTIARKLGVPAEKLDLVTVWREAGIYTPRELAALAWTEALTDMNKGADSDAAYAQLREHFTETDIAFLTVAIGTINQWNRIAGGLRFAPPVPARAGGSGA